MSRCLCAEHQPCSIHKERPLVTPDVVKHHTYVVHVYHIWSRKKWYATVGKDAGRVAETDLFDTKQEAIDAINLSPSSHVHHNTAPGGPSGSMKPVEQTHPGQPLILK